MVEDWQIDRGMKWAALEKQSTMVKMIVWPWEESRPVTKSNAVWDQGQLGTGRGGSRPELG